MKHTTCHLLLTNPDTHKTDWLCVVIQESSSLAETEKMISQPPFIYSKLAIETLEQGVKYVQS